jgi:hypothetical protein
LFRSADAYIRESSEKPQRRSRGCGHPRSYFATFAKAFSELRMPIKTSSWLHPKFSVFSVISCSTGLLSGCSRAPTFDIVGSFFPAWLVCLIAGIFLASFAHWLLSRLKITLLVPILVYPSLAALFTLLLWLAFFS